MGTRIGELLNRRWKIGAKHSLFNTEGVWYHLLTDFPGALCDPYGYVVFRTEAEFRACPMLRIGQEVNLNGHISQIPGYVKVQPDQVYRGR